MEDEANYVEVLKFMVKFKIKKMNMEHHLQSKPEAAYDYFIDKLILNKMVEIIYNFIKQFAKLGNLQFHLFIFSLFTSFLFNLSNFVKHPLFYMADIFKFVRGLLYYFCIYSLCETLSALCTTIYPPV